MPQRPSTLKVIVKMQQNDQDEKPELSPESVAYLRGRPKSERSPLGQFLTPRQLREKLISQIPFAPGMRVLDPGCGTGEFLKSCAEVCPELQLFGWDVDEKVLEVAKILAPTATLLHRSALDAGETEKFDVVIGNPPYFEMRGLSEEIKDDYSEVISGRPNIFALFFKAGWAALKNNGYLAYVVPPSMNNGAYFDKLRHFIITNFSIEYLELYENPFLFEDAQTAVQLMVLKKGSTSNNFWVDLGDLSGSTKRRRIFVANAESFVQEYEGRTTVGKLGYTAITGSIVWNNVKERLTMESDDQSIPLIWAHNITGKDEVELRFDNPRKPQFVRGFKGQLGPAIVVNRITGSVGSGTLRCALVPEGMRFVAENHVNVIVKKEGEPQEVPFEVLLEALRGSGVNDRVRKLTGNTQISATELTNWIPLDV